LDKDYFDEAEKDKILEYYESVSKPIVENGNIFLGKPETDRNP
jgi:hypothetical protein